MIKGVLYQLTRLLYPHGSIRRVYRGPCKGVLYQVQDSMGLTFAWGRGAYGYPLKWLDSKIKPGMVVYDIGGNRGVTALFFAQRVGEEEEVVVFEPVPQIYKQLCYNLELNNFDKVKTYCIALSDVSGQAAFDYDEKFSTQGKLNGCEQQYITGTSSTITVETELLDVVVEKLKFPDILKIDVEGAADLVFKGAVKTIDNAKPSVCIELHGPDEQKAVKEHLLDRGYVVDDFQGRKVEDPTVGWNSPLWCYYQR